jgi:hypothetical protein
MYKKSNSSFNFSKNGNMNKNSNGSFSNTRLASSQVVRMAPRPFSPFYEESNLMLPRDRREINAWARHYYATDPTVGNAIDLHSTYPLSAFGVKCEDPYITKFFNQMLDDINFSTLIFDIGKEYNIIGEVFPYGELNPSTGMWEKVIVQNPDYMEVRSNNLANPMMSLIPDEELKRLATSSNPDDIALREQMSQEMLAYVYSGRNIPLKDFNISHISRKNSPYDVRGTSMLTRIYKDLMLRDKFRESLFAIADNHVNPLKVFKVGTADGTYRPTEDDLQAFRDMLAQATYDPNFTLVTHPGLEIQYVGSSGAILPLEGYLDRIQENILTGLYISKTFTSSEGPTYASSSVALEILQQRYVSFRTLLEKWLELKIFKPISKLHGFYKVVGGREELIIPKVNWDKINLKNSSEYQNMIKDLVRDHSVSKRTLHKALDLNYEEEMERIKKEAEDQAEIEYKLNLPYVGPENINVSGEAKAEMPQEEQEQSEKKPPEGGGGSDFGGLGDMGGIGGDIGGDLGDAGLGEEMGTEASPDLSTGGGAESAPAI